MAKRKRPRHREFVVWCCGDDWDETVKAIAARVRWVHSINPDVKLFLWTSLTVCSGCSSKYLFAYNRTLEQPTMHIFHKFVDKKGGFWLCSRFLSLKLLCCRESKSYKNISWLSDTVQNAHKYTNKHKDSRGGVRPRILSLVRGFSCYCNARQYSAF